MADDPVPSPESPQIPVSEGLPSATIETVSEPTSETLVDTPTEPAEPANKAAEVTVEQQREPPTPEPKPGSSTVASAPTIDSSTEPPHIAN